MHKNKIIKGIEDFYKSMIFCFKISWQSSKFHTMVRFLYAIILPIINITSIYIFKIIIDIITGRIIFDDNKRYLIILFVFSVIINILLIAFKKYINYANYIHDEKIILSLNSNILRKTQTADLELFDEPKYYDKLLSVQRDTNGITTMIWNLLDLVSALITFVSTFFILNKINFIYSLILTFSSFPTMIIGILFTKKMYQLNLNLIPKERKRNYIYRVSTAKSFSQEIRLFNIGKFLEEKYNEISYSLLNIRKSYIKKQNLISLILDSIPIIVAFYITISLALNVFNNLISIGDFTFYTSIINNLQASITLLTSNIFAISENTLKVNNIYTLSNFDNKIIDNGDIILKNIFTIEFENISFKYPNTNLKILNNINFKINTGEKVAIIGENGSGKTTIIKLLLRFYKPDNGKILINNADIENYTLLSLRKCFSTYFQSSPNFGFTLKENIILGDNECENNDKILSTMKISNLDFDFNKFKLGFDTYITKEFDKDGVELSIGQHQKLNLSRTFFRKASVFILDEPTASLDSISQNILFQYINNDSSGKIYIFITHNMKDISIAQKIIYIQNDGSTIFDTLDTLKRTNKKFVKFIQGNK